MAIDKELITYVAHLARMDLKQEESDKLAGQLKDILGFIDKLAEIDTGDIPPTSHILPLNNVLREDSSQESLPAEKTLSNAPQKKENFFVVPKIIE